MSSSSSLPGSTGLNRSVALGPWSDGRTAPMAVPSLHGGRLDQLDHLRTGLSRSSPRKTPRSGRREGPEQETPRREGPEEFLILTGRDENVSEDGEEHEAEDFWMVNNYHSREASPDSVATSSKSHSDHSRAASPDGKLTTPRSDEHNGSMPPSGSKSSSPRKSQSLLQMEMDDRTPTQKAVSGPERLSFAPAAWASPTALNETPAQVFHMEEYNKQRALSELLWEAFPKWMPWNLQNIMKRLANSGVESLEDLQEMMNRSSDLELGEEIITQLQQILNSVDGQDGFESGGTIGKYLMPNQINHHLLITAKAIRSRLVDGRFVSQPSSWAPPGDLGPNLLPLGAREKPQDADEVQQNQQRMRSNALYFSEQRRLLCDLLWDSQPTWTPNDFVRAEGKLAMLDIHGIGTLDASLATVGELNQRLRTMRVRAFSSQTLQAFRERLDIAFGRDWDVESDGVDKELVWMQATSGDVNSSDLRTLLRESRPSWTSYDLDAVEVKLRKIGVDTVSRLSEAISGDLNKLLREAGQKPFSEATVQELRSRLG